MTYTYGTVTVFIQFDLKKNHCQNVVVFGLPAPPPAKTSQHCKLKRRKDLHKTCKHQLKPSSPNIKNICILSRERTLMLKNIRCLNFWRRYVLEQIPSIQNSSRKGVLDRNDPVASQLFFASSQKDKIVNVLLAVSKTNGCTWGLFKEF